MKIVIAAVLLVLSISAQAALIDRGGGFIYDDVLDVTWLQDANHSQTSGHDTDGQMTWQNAVAWADGLSIYDPVRDVIWDDWRLPTTLQPDPSCSSQYYDSIWDDEQDPPPEQGRGFGCTGSEMGHLYNVDGGQLDLFTNLQSSYYWSGTRFVGGGGLMWEFNFNNGYQSFGYGADEGYALAVRSGDVAAVPIPAPILLFGSALVALWVRSRRPL